ncbi:flagellar filament capping protein FliD [Inquilinus sp. CAU 1745]|uniref:flagellar filament capping protein FliD n=1 Tax=Inquilinus sp. CAU 1745 TaxID=3140369 RepID=UPI00325AB19B
MISGLDGNLTLVNGQPRLTGVFSGLDTEAIIQASVQVKRIPAVRLENRVSQNEVKVAAYQEMSNLLDLLRTAANALRNPPGSTGLADNVFQQKAAFLTSSSATPATELLGVTAANGAAVGIYDIEVIQIAKAHKLSGTAVQIGGAPAASSSDALGLTDTLTLGLRDGPDGTDALGATATVDITASMSLDDVATAINAETGTTGVRASVLKVADNDFRLVLTADNTNQRIDLQAADPATLTALGGMANNLETPQGAELNFGGTTIYRDSNEITDLIDNVTFDLYKAEVGTNVRVEIEPNTAAVKTALTGFVDAYNAVRDLIISQQTASEDGADENAVLFGDNILRSLSTRLGGDVAASVGLSGDVLSTLRDVGVTMTPDNKLSIDATKLDSTLIEKYDEVRSVFEFGFNSSSTDVRVLGRDRPLGVSEFTLRFTGPNDSSGGATGVEVVGYGEVFEISGNRLIGKAGTAFEGLDLAYVGTPDDPAPADITISLSNGVAEKIYQTVDFFTRPVDGQITAQIERLNEQNEDFLAQVTQIDERLEIYRQTLVEKYTRMEQAIAAADAMQKQLRAMMGIKDD